MNAFDRHVHEATQQGLTATSLDILQVNTGLRCNNVCAHCHLDSGPGRNEMMDWPTMQTVAKVADHVRPQLVDITGGAPELNPHLRAFIKTLRKQRHAVQVRTNLTVFFEPEMECMPDFYGANGVHVVASMPCHLEQNVRAQRGPGVYDQSIAGIRRLNAEGYGRDPRLPLHLVHNPPGPFLPPAQHVVESDYRRELGERLDLAFTDLYTITNVPIGRFGAQLRREGKETQYCSLLEASFNPCTLPRLMCRHQINVGWDGTLYDCDFNLALRVPVSGGAPTHIDQFDVSSLMNRPIATGTHCFACTAGKGSSCTGALA
jgi:radical SAM/Cys-rich protein